MSEQEPSRELRGVSAPADTVLTSGGLSAEERLALTTEKVPGRHRADTGVLGKLGLGFLRKRSLPEPESHPQLPADLPSESEVNANLDGYPARVEASKVDRQAKIAKQADKQGLSVDKHETAA
jgi:hypothetical protein